MKTTPFTRLSGFSQWLAPAFLLGLWLSVTCASGQTLLNSGTGWTQYSTANGWVLYDVVDTSGWSVLGGSFVTSGGGLSPTSGTTFFNGANTGTASNRGVDRYYTGITLQPGTYTVTLDIGDFNTQTFTTSSFNINLLADTGNNGYTYSDRITAASSSKTNPTDSWTTWSYTFTITDSTTTAGSVNAIGSQLGFLVLANVAASGYAFDNLTITYTVPETSTMMSVATGLIAIGTVLIRRRLTS